MEKYFFRILIILNLFILTGASAINSQLPICTTYKDVKKNHGKKVLLVGRYEVDLVQGGKKLQAANIVLADKTRIIRSYRPVKKEYQYIGKKVKITGKVYTNAGQPNYVQQVMAPHIYPESIELAEGEKPYDIAPKFIPEAIWVNSKEEIEKNDDHWVHIYGKLIEVNPIKNDSFWAEAVIEIQDHTLVKVSYAHTPKWRALAGKMVTVTAIVHLYDDEFGKRYVIHGSNAVCQGKVSRCGIYDPDYPDIEDQEKEEREESQKK